MGTVSTRNFALKLAGGALSLVVVCGTASAFTISDSLPSTPSQSTVSVYHEEVDAPKVDNVAWCRWGCGRRWGYGPGWGYRGWGWGGPAVVGGLAAGAIVGSALAAPAYGYYGGCWRQIWGPVGWYWTRIC
jgi:hypothetical protein